MTLEYVALQTPIELLQPAEIAFGAGARTALAQFAARHGVRRSLVVADSFPPPAWKAWACRAR